MQFTPQEMRKIGTRMSILMGITISFFLSLIGMLSSGHFTIPGFIMNFLVSLVISLLIGFLVPMKKLSDGLTAKCGLKPRSLLTHLLESLVSDLLYTPIITFAMVFLNYKIAVSHGAVLSFWPMFLPSLFICFICGYFLILLFMPVYLTFVTRSIQKEKN